MTGPPRVSNGSYLSVGAQVILAVPGASHRCGGLSTRGPWSASSARTTSRGTLWKAALDRLTGPGVIIVDDAELLRTCDAGDVLQSVVRNATGRDVGIVIAGNAEDVCGGFSGWQVDLKRARRGLLLSPQNMSDADLIGVRLQRGSARRSCRAVACSTSPDGGSVRSRSRRPPCSRPGRFAWPGGSARRATARKLVRKARPMVVTKSLSPRIT